MKKGFDLIEVVFRPAFADFAGETGFEPVLVTGHGTVELHRIIVSVGRRHAGEEVPREVGRRQVRLVG